MISNIKQNNTNEETHPITIKDKLQIGGVNQWLFIHGKSTGNPILLFLHGGPGSAEWPLVRHYNSTLEEYFIIAYWEQRGAGKSFSRKIANMNVTQFIADTYDIIQYLKSRFKQEKVFLIGHSWGSIIGILTAQRYPELLYAYIGMGQFVSGKENEKNSYRYTHDMAIKTNNKKAIKQIEKLNYPEPYETIDLEGKWLRKLMLQRNWLYKFGGCVYQKISYFKWVWPFLKAPEYSLKDLIKWLLGYYFSIKIMWPEIMQLDLFKQVPRIKVPVFFLIGRHDYNTPFELSEKYFLNLIAPKKELVWFDYSAHSPIYEEASKFNDILISKVRDEINN